MVISLLSVLFIGAALGQECTLPTFTEDVDWRKVEGTYWYETVRVGDAYENAFKCKVEYDIQATKNGYKARIGDQSEQDAPLVELQRVGVGKYQVVKTSQDILSENVVKTSLLNESPSEAVSSLQNEIAVASSVMGFYIDPDMRFEFALVCKDDSTKYVAVKTRTPKPTVEDVIDIHNILVAFGWSDVTLAVNNNCVDKDEMQG